MFDSGLAEATRKNLEMLKNIKWEVVKKFFEKETEKLAKEVLM